MFHSLAVKRYLLLLLVAYLLPIANSIQAQVAACGLPTSGTITSSVTYTLTADCEQTGQLSISGNVTVTINGAGFTIAASSVMEVNFVNSVFTLTPTSTLNLNQLTIDGAGYGIPTLIETGGGGFAADRVSFRNSYGVNLNVSGAATLTNVLFEGNLSTAFHTTGNASGINVGFFGGAVTITNAVFRNNYDGGGAIVINASGSGSVTTNGCLTFSGNIPYNVVGSWTDNSTGLCSGAIGNGDPAAIAPPSILPCGLPGVGNLDRSASYRMRSDCDLSGTESKLWRISEGVNISIQGNGYRLSAGSGNEWRWIEQAGRGTLTLRNVVVDHVKTYSFGTLNVDHGTFRDTSDRVFFHLGTATFRNSRFENITTMRTAGNASVLLVLDDYGSGQATISNAVFRNITSDGAPVLNTSGSSTITLNGCITFENSTPPNFAGNVTDNSTGACEPNTIVGPTGPVPDEPRKPTSEPEGAVVVVDRKPENCFQQLGAIGSICRPPNRPETTFEIWGVTPESQVFFIMELRQSQVVSQPLQGLVASSPDGRVAVRVVGSDCVIRNRHGDDPRVSSAECIAGQLGRPAGATIGTYRHIVISMGPTFEGKVHNVVFDNSLAGSVIGTVDTFTGLPGVVATTAADSASTTTTESPSSVSNASSVHPQPARADGSIIHIVQAGDTVNAMALAYKVSARWIIERNQLADANTIMIGQELLIRDAN